MQHRVTLLMRIASEADSQSGMLRLIRPDTRRNLAVPQLTLLLTLTHEPDTTFCRGLVTLLHNNTTYPIQSDAAFYQALVTFVGLHETTE